MSSVEPEAVWAGNLEVDIMKPNHTDTQEILETECLIYNLVYHRNVKKVIAGSP